VSSAKGSLTTRTDALIAQAERFGAHNYAPLPVVLEHAQGSWVTDVEGRRYLDCISAYSSLNQGHRHPHIVAALLEQAGRLTLTSRAVHNDRMGTFLERLCSTCGYEMALPMNTGGEAVETAIKLARKWAYSTGKAPQGTGEIVVCRNNFHGRTTTIVGFSSEPQYRDSFGPYGPGFRSVEFGDAAALESAITSATIGFLVEPIQAEAGILLPPEGYLRDVRRICSDAGILFMLDEIQTGLGRTGRLMAYEHEPDARPDVLILGKALGGGVYPVSTVLSSRDILGVFRPGDHGSTFGGNPLGASVAIAALEVIEREALTEKARVSGEFLINRLRALDSPLIRDVRGKGLLIGIEIRRDAGTARSFAMKLLKRGVLAKDTHEQVLRFAPPLNTMLEDLEWLVEASSKVFTR
jgi:ornithine--oxo-acid transaminase